MRRVLESSRNEVGGERRSLCKEALLGLYSPTKIIREIDQECVVSGMCSTSGGDTCTNLVCKPEEERPLGRLPRKWDNSIKIDVTGIW